MIEVHEEEPSDRAAIRAVVTRAFGRAAEADLVDQLRSDGDIVLSLVASDAGTVVGHILFSCMRGPLLSLGLAPVSVAPERQRCGIGSRLIRLGLERAARAGWEAVFVLGEPDFYRRFSFDAALARGFVSPYAGPYLMAKALRGELSVSSGAVEYPPAFSRLTEDPGAAP